MSHLLIIGGTSGIGEAIAKQAIDKFDRVTVPERSDLDVCSSTNVETYIRDKGWRDPITHTVYSAGVASLEWIKDLMNGVLDRGDIQNEFEKVYNVNVFGFLRVMTALSRSFARGRVVAIVSDASRTPMRGSIAYCSSKAALAAAIKVAARELAPDWSVNGISPSAVFNTPLTDWIDEKVPKFRGWTRAEAAGYEMAGVPKKRRAYKDEVAELTISTLLGPDFVSGSIIDITGGK